MFNASKISYNFVSSIFTNICQHLTHISVIANVVGPSFPHPYFTSVLSHKQMRYDNCKYVRVSHYFFIVYILQLLIIVIPFLSFVTPKFSENMQLSFLWNVLVDASCLGVGLVSGKNKVLRYSFCQYTSTPAYNFKPLSECKS